LCATRAWPPELLTPEFLERDIEYCQLFRTVNEQRAARVVNLVTCAEIHVTECFYHVDHTPRVDVDSRAAEDSSEEEQIIEKPRHENCYPYEKLYHGGH
jgi:hypothetical protein